jgi:4-alpha-glucanotransferase
LLFEKLGDRFRAPGEYVRNALATVTTHDMPTLRSYWEGRDIALRRGLNLYPSVELENDIVREREHDRGLLLMALREQGLAPAQPAGPYDPFTAELAQSLHLYLARSAAVLASVQIEDLLGMVDPVNVPGTHLEYPNWQRKITSDVEEMAERGDLSAQLMELDRARS